MVATRSIPRKPNPTQYTGPRDTDPLTEDELSLLLAIPRAAQSTPDSILFRLPRGTDPSLGWVDVTCAEACSIVSHLAARWETKLSKVLRPQTQGTLSAPGPGVTICILVRPSVYALFHFLAFWSLGCTVQYLSTNLDGSVIDANLVLSSCQCVLHLEMGEAWVRERTEKFAGTMVELPESEYAHRLVEAERRSTAKCVLPWPAPRRPTPALILQSSGTTNAPKPLKFSLYFYTIGHKLNCQNHLASACSQGDNPRTIYTHPRLMVSPPHWQNFYRSFFVHLSTATPLALAPILDPDNLLPNEFMTWVKGLDAGGTVGCTYLIREILADGAQTHILKNMYSVSVSGSAVDEQTSQLFEMSGIPLTNNLGCSEFSRILYTSRPPYNLLRPFQDLPSPLVNPLTERRPDGSRDVELWFSSSSSPHFAHLLVHGGVPLDVEPFPGEGPHHGELAYNSKDILREVITESNEVAYIHLGRTDELIRPYGGAIEFNASVYESRFRTLVQHEGGYAGWRLDIIQLFGSNMPAAALVVQLTRQQEDESPSQPTLRALGTGIFESFSRCVEEVNIKMDLGVFRVNPRKRLLVITTEGEVYGPGSDRLVGLNADRLGPRLTVTHKHTIRRWANLQAFKPWLDGLDYSESRIDWHIGQ